MIHRIPRRSSSAAGLFACSLQRRILINFCKISVYKDLKPDPFKWNVWRINASTTADALASHWNTYDVQGIDVESARGPGFYTYINQSGNKYRKLQVKGSSKIGYHYLYIDGTGRENNATWYSRTEGSGYINVVSV